MRWTRQTKAAMFARECLEDLGIIYFPPAQVRATDRTPCWRARCLSHPARVVACRNWEKTESMLHMLCLSSLSAMRPLPHCKRRTPAPDSDRAQNVEMKSVTSFEFDPFRELEMGAGAKV